MEDDDDDETTPEWIAYFDHLCFHENSMNPIENLLVTIMVVNGATYDLAKKCLQFEVVFIQMIITMLHDLVCSIDDLMENPLTPTMKKLAEEIMELLAPTSGKEPFPKYTFLKL